MLLPVLATLASSSNSPHDDNGHANPADPNNVIKDFVTLATSSEFVIASIIGSIVVAVFLVNTWNSFTKERAIKLTVNKWRAHNANYHRYHPQHLLNEGTHRYYGSDPYQPLNEDWIVFKYHNDEALKFMLTKVIIHNGLHQGIKKIAILGRPETQSQWEKWITINDIANNQERQTFPIDAASGKAAMNKKYKYFKLRMLESYGGPKSGYHKLYEFALIGKRNIF